MGRAGALQAFSRREGRGGTGRILVRAAEIQDDAEREALYARQVERRPGFAEYPKKTNRRIPIIALSRG